MERRRFLQALLAALGGAALPLGCGTTSGASSLPVPPGIQLYTVRAALADDLEGTLGRLAAIGYREVETHSYFGRTPAQMRGALDRAGLDAPAAHYSAAALRDDLPAAVDAAGAIGHRYVICPHPGVLPHATLDDYRAMADVLNEIGAALHAHGIRFGYHNHDFELARLDGEIPLFVLLDRTDPEHVVLELDLYWAVHGGQDPIAIIERYPGRVHAWHVKDRTAAGQMVDIGDGVIDFAAIFARHAQAGLRHAFVEHDRPTDPLGSAARSFEALTGQTARGV